MHCQQFFSDELDGVNDAPKARFATCLTRLKLLAVDNPKLGKKVRILRRQLREQQLQERKSSPILLAVVFGVVAAAVGLGVWPVRARSVDGPAQGRIRRRAGCCRATLLKRHVPSSFLA